MYESRREPLLSRTDFIRRVVNHLAAAFGLLAVSLLVGIAGYAYFEKLPWVDAFLNSAMLLGGMGPVDPATGGRNLGPIAEQIRQTLRNMAHMLESAGSGLDRIVKMAVVLADSADYDEMNRVWREFFSTDPPARTTCALQLSNGNGVEIECIALAGQNPS